MLFLSGKWFGVEYEQNETAFVAEKAVEKIASYQNVHFQIMIKGLKQIIRFLWVAKRGSKEKQEEQDNSEQNRK